MAMVALHNVIRWLELPCTLARKLCCSHLRKRIHFFRAKSSFHGNALPSPLSPFPFAKSFSCQAVTIGSETVRQTSLSAASHIAPDRASITNDLVALGLEFPTLDRLACLPDESFLEQWKKIQLLLGAGASSAQIRPLLGRSRISLSRFLTTPYEKLFTVVKVFEGVHLDRRTAGAILTQSAVLRSSVETLKSRLKYFQSMGMERGLFKCLLCRPAWILSVRIVCVEERLEALKAIGFYAKEMQDAFCKFPRVLSYDFNKCLVPKVEYLESIGFGKKSILKLLVRSPGIVGVSIEVISQKANLFRKLGIANSPEALIRALTYLFSYRCETIQSRFDWFRNKGFSFEEAGRLGRFPVVFQKSPKDLERRFDYLENSLERDKREVLAAPVFLCCAFESRIVSRFNLLREKGLLNSNVTLASVICPSNAKFESKVTNSKFGSS